MEEMFKQIMSQLTNLNTKVDSLENSQNQIQSDIKEMKSDIKELNTKVDAVYEQTADLTEFKNSTSEKLDKVFDDIEFIKHEGFETKQDLFAIKRNLKSIK